MPIIALLKLGSENIVKDLLNRIEEDPNSGRLFLWQIRASTKDKVEKGVDIDKMSEIKFRFSVLFDVVVSFLRMSGYDYADML